MQIKGDKQNTPHLTYRTLCPCLMLTLALCPMLTLCPTLAPCTLHRAHAHTCTLPPPSLSYLFTPLALYQAVYSLIQHFFTHLALLLPMPLSHYALLHTHTMPPLFSSLCTHIETLTPLSHPQSPIGLLL